MDLNSQLHVLATLPLRKNRDNQWIRGWVSPRGGLDTVEKRGDSCSCRESKNDSWIVYSVAQVSRAIPNYQQFSMKITLRETELMDFKGT
jgi:hypothetical protein